MIGCESVRERIEKFDAEHGNDGIVIDGWLLFSDGAMRELSPLGMMRKVPNDIFKAAKLKVHYWEAKLGLAVEEFSTFKKNLLSRAKAALNQRYCPPPPPPEAIEKLKKLKAKVEGFQAKLVEAENNVENAKPDNMKRAEQADEDSRRKNEDFANTIMSIEV
jgi:hypothetical protein